MPCFESLIKMDYCGVTSAGITLPLCLGAAAGILYYTESNDITFYFQSINTFTQESVGLKGCIKPHCTEINRKRTILNESILLKSDQTEVISVVLNRITPTCK